MATDSLITSGGQLAALSTETMAALNSTLPAQWSHANPIDILGDADPERYAKALDIVAKDPNNDGLLVILTPQAMTDPSQTAEKLRPLVKSLGKPVIASWMGGDSVAAGMSILDQASIPTFPFPDTAARVFQYMWRYSANLRLLFETPSLASQFAEEPADGGRVEKIVQAARSAGRQLLTEFESKQILASYRIPTVETRCAGTRRRSARNRLGRLGFPVVLKLHSETITHKTDVGGVQLNLSRRAAVRTALSAHRSVGREQAGAEHFLGVTVQPMITLEGYEIDPREQHRSAVRAGAAVRVGRAAGGGVQGSRAGLAAAQHHAGPRMMERTRIFTALKGVRGRKPVDLRRWSNCWSGSAISWWNSAGSRRSTSTR